MIKEKNTHQKKLFCEMKDFYQELYREREVEPEARQICLKGLQKKVMKEDQQQLEENWKDRKYGTPQNI